MLEGKPVMALPKNLDNDDWFALNCYERYGWSPGDIDDLPLAHAAYIPVLWAAINEIRKDQERRQSR